jgi:plasmid replication initiation protein
MDKLISSSNQPNEDRALIRFRRVLRRKDQQALDELMAAAKKHSPAAALVPHVTPLEILLLSMLIEEHKEVQRLRIQLERLTAMAPSEMDI